MTTERLEDVSIHLRPSDLRSRVEELTKELTKERKRADDLESGYLVDHAHSACNRTLCAVCILRTDNERLRSAHQETRAKVEKLREALASAAGSLERIANHSAWSPGETAQFELHRVLGALASTEPTEGATSANGSADSGIERPQASVAASETPSPKTGTEGENRGASPDQVKHMIQRFLGWKLPADFRPDGGIAFTAIQNRGTPYEFKREPVGTNLFDATQAEAMVRHMLEGLPPAPTPRAFTPEQIEEAIRAARLEPMKSDGRQWLEIVGVDNLRRSLGLSTQDGGK